MEPTAWTAGNEYLCLGISWRTGNPCLDTLEIPTSRPMEIPLLNQRIGMRAAGSGKYCTGRFAFERETATRHVPCPAGRLADKGAQCEACGARDEFRMVHHAHSGGPVSPALARYLAQPHWVYIATFADGSSKVGTAAEPRRRSRLDEQGALMAHYVARTGDGRTARQVEDRVTRVLSVTQFKRGSAKASALASFAGGDAIAAGHHSTVRRATALVAELDGELPDLKVTDEPWSPPTAMRCFLRKPPAGGWALYPNDLRTGEHGFQVEGCAGQAAAVTIRQADDPVRYVVDLGALKGVRVVAGDFHSVAAPVQNSLF